MRPISTRLVATLPGSDTLSTLASYETALRLNHDCAAESLLGAIAPRAGGLLPHARALAFDLDRRLRSLIG